MEIGKHLEEFRLFKNNVSERIENEIKERSSLCLQVKELFEL